MCLQDCNLLEALHEATVAVRLYYSALHNLGRLAPVQPEQNDVFEIGNPPEDRNKDAASQGIALLRSNQARVLASRLIYVSRLLRERTCSHTIVQQLLDAHLLVAELAKSRGTPKLASYFADQASSLAEKTGQAFQRSRLDLLKAEIAAHSKLFEEATIVLAQDSKRSALAQVTKLLIRANIELHAELPEEAVRTCLMAEDLVKQMHKLYENADTEHFLASLLSQAKQKRGKL